MSTSHFEISHIEAFSVQVVVKSFLYLYTVLLHPQPHYRHRAIEEW